MSAPTTTKTQQTQDFNAAVLKGSFDVTIAPGATQCEVTVEATPETMERLRMSVENNELHLKMEEKSSFLNIGNVMPSHCKVTIAAPAFTYLYLKGAGNLTATDVIRNDSVKVKLKGAGNINLEIEATMKAQAKLEGAGTMKIKAVAPELKASVEGTGSLKLSGGASRLKTELDGVGNIDASECIAQDGEARLRGIGHIKVNIAGNANLINKGMGKIENITQSQ